MFEFIEKARLQIQQTMERRKLQRHQDAETKVVNDSKQYETDKTSLERQVELEKLKADVRKEEQKAQPKNGVKKQEEKSAFAAFQDYATNFANQPSVFGEINSGGQHGKKNNKGSRKRN